ncbi:reverse transcriptase domain-containing protein [Tanacetum coccineum]
MPVCPNPYPAGLFADPTGSVTPFVRWIEDYPLPDGLKMPSHVGSYDGKRDPASKRGSQKRTWQFISSNREKARVLEPSSLDTQMTPCRFWVYMKIGVFSVSFMQEKSPLMELRMIKGTTSKGQGNLPGTMTGDRGVETEKSTTPSEAPILMINKEEACTRNNVSKSPTFEGREITFPLVTKGRNSSAPVIIKAKIFGREVGRVHMDSGSLCEVIYEHCFLKLKPSIQASKVDSRVSLVGFLGEKSWAIGEVLLDITIGNALLTRSKTLNFVIVRSNSPYNILLGRTTMKKMGMVVSTIHEAVKFHTTQGIRTVFSTYESGRIEGVKKVRETSPSNIEWVISCINTEEKIIVNNKYPDQTITIGKQLPEHFKERLQNLLRPT